jgi:hypothetical protein
MRRECSDCGRAYEPADLDREQSRGLEADRKAAVLDGVRFLAYRCPCGAADVFVDILPLADEFAEDFDGRKAAMEEAVRRLPAGGVHARVVPVHAP